jgi:hypothetical protein
MREVTKRNRETNRLKKKIETERMMVEKSKDEYVIKER